MLGLKRVKLDQENMRSLAFVLLSNLFWEVVFVFFFFENLANSRSRQLYFLSWHPRSLFAKCCCRLFCKLPLWVILQTLRCRPFSWKFCKLQFHVTTLQIVFLCFCKIWNLLFRTPCLLIFVRDNLFANCRSWWFDFKFCRMLLQVTVFFPQIVIPDNIFFANYEKARIFTFSQV